MKYILGLSVMLVSIYSYSFAAWLGKEGNKAGQWGVVLLLVLNLLGYIFQAAGG